MGVVRAELVEVKANSSPFRAAPPDGRGRRGRWKTRTSFAREDMVIAVTHGGYVKRTPLWPPTGSSIAAAEAGPAMATKEEDAVTRVFSASTHAPMLFFSSGGKAYKLKVWRLPLGTPTSRGKAFVNLFPIEHGRDHDLDPHPSRGRGGLGGAGRDVRHPIRRRAAQQAVGLRPDQPLRQDRHEARRRRLDRRGQPVHQRPTTCCSRTARTAARSASRWTRCACSPSRDSTGVRGIRLSGGRHACFPWRSCAPSKPRRRNGSPSCKPRLARCGPRRPARTDAEDATPVLD